MQKSAKQKHREAQRAKEAESREVKAKLKASLLTVVDNEEATPAEKLEASKLLQEEGSGSFPKKERRNTMIYLNSDRTEFIESDAFIGCGNEVREDLNREYHAPTAQELYDFIYSQPTWDCVPPDAYDQLADLCGIGYTEEDSLETLMDRCAAALEEAQKELQRQADEAQEMIERAGVWKPE